MNMTRDDAKRCVGAGWGRIIDEIFDKLPEDAYIAQVKEKYGGLRFYVDNVPEAVSNLIWEKELESENVCELCGEEGKIIIVNGWYMCRCKKHEGKNEV